jgi:hypothetical protein
LGIQSAEQLAGQVGVLGPAPAGGPVYGQAPWVRFQLRETFPAVL